MQFISPEDVYRRNWSVTSKGFCIKIDLALKSSYILPHFRGYGIIYIPDINYSCGNSHMSSVDKRQILDQKRLNSNFTAPQNKNTTGFLWGIPTHCYLHYYVNASVAFHITTYSILTMQWPKMNNPHDTIWPLPFTHHFSSKFLRTNIWAVTNMGTETDGNFGISWMTYSSQCSSFSG